MLLKKFKNDSSVKNKRGFTLVELLVTLSIFVIVTSVVLFSQRSFNTSIVLTNLAYELSLYIRQAQVYGVSGRSAGFDNESTPSHGVHLSTAQENKENKKIIFFSDLNEDGVYNDDEIDSQYNIGRNNKISSILKWSNGVFSSESSATVDIVFRRPDPDAYIKIDDFEKVTSVRIVVGSDSDPTATRYVDVVNNGMISVGR